jgi:hypothetical protein
MALSVHLIIIAACTVATVAVQIATPIPDASSPATVQRDVKAPHPAVTFSSQPVDARVIMGETYVDGSINGSRALDVVLDSAASVALSHRNWQRSCTSRQLRREWLQGRAKGATISCIWFQT